jgi:hypothetical protein
MNGWGTKGIARTIPTNPLAGVATFVGELRQVPQRFDPLKWKEAIKDLRKLPRRTAEEWLNFNFGYVPVVNDIKKFVDVTAKHDQYVTRLIRNSGKNVRRRVDLYSNQTSDSVVISENAYGTPILATEAYLRTGRVTRSVTTTEKIWFSGCYTYWLPSEVLGKRHGNNISQRKRIRQILYGDKVDVDTLWNLAPWTWALDWIGTSGDVIHNMNAFANDELVMRYGYVMRMYETRVDFALDGVVLRVAGPVSASQTCFLTNKQRSKATPYGFGINPSGFTARQWATIGALGISRVPNSLRV